MAKRAEKEQETAQEKAAQEEAAQEETAQEEAAQEEAALPNPCVYCGPSVKGVTRQYTTYQGGIPGALREFFQAHPEALGLVTSTEEFPAMRRRLETPGTKEAELYKAVKAVL